ncbi:aldo/keto reductase [Agreia sp. Leaf244]|nr:aldo/keto reductase [Agreia sp. Leaf244]
MVDDIEIEDSIASRLGLGLAAIGRPAYITAGRAKDLGEGADRSVDAMRERAHKLLDAAWWLGIRYVDAARSYGRAEEFLGSWLAAHPGYRDELTIGSKWGYEYTGDWRLDAAQQERKEHSLAMFDRQWAETLEALGTEPDVYLVHSLTSDSTALDDGALLDRLRALRESGVRVGFSTSGPAQAAVIERALGLADSPFSAVQSTWNLLEPSVGEALAAANDAKWLVVVKEVLANGRLTSRAAGAGAAGGSVPGAADESVPGAAGEAVPDAAVAAAAALAAEDGQRVDGLAIGAAVAHPWADIVLTGAVTRKQLKQNLEARAPSLDEERLAALAEPAEQYWEARAARPWS